MERASPKPSFTLDHIQSIASTSKSILGLRHHCLLNGLNRATRCLPLSVQVLSTADQLLLRCLQAMDPKELCKIEEASRLKGLRCIIGDLPLDSIRYATIVEELMRLEYEDFCTAVVQDDRICAVSINRNGILRLVAVTSVCCCEMKNDRNVRNTLTSIRRQNQLRALMWPEKASRHGTPIPAAGIPGVSNLVWMASRTCNRGIVRGRFRLEWKSTTVDGTAVIPMDGITELRVEHRARDYKSVGAYNRIEDFWQGLAALLHQISED